MSRKNTKEDFNACTGKIVNVAEFEAALDEALGESLKEHKGLAKVKDSIAQKIQDRQHKPVSLEDTTWPVVYTRDTAAETAQALAEMKQWPVTVTKKGEPPFKTTFGALHYGEPEGPIIEDFTKIPSARVPVSPDKIYFEASSLMASVREHGGLSQAFKDSIEKCADHRDLLDEKLLSEADSPNDSGYDVSINLNTGAVAVKAFALPEGNHLNTQVLGGGKHIQATRIDVKTTRKLF
jgi:hypothetical protein